MIFYSCKFKSKNMKQMLSIFNLINVGILGKAGLGNKFWNWQQKTTSEEVDPVIILSSYLT